MKLRAIIAEAIERALQQQSEQANQKAWMAPREAAEYLGCTTQHLQMLRAPAGWTDVCQIWPVNTLRPRRSG